MVLFYSIIRNKREKQAIPLELSQAQATISTHCQKLIYDESNIVCYQPIAISAVEA